MFFGLWARKARRAKSKKWVIGWQWFPGLCGATDRPFCCDIEGAKIQYRMDRNCNFSLLGRTLAFFACLL